MSGRVPLPNPAQELEVLAVGDAYLCKPAGSYPGTPLKQMAKWVRELGEAVGLAPEDRVVLVYEHSVVQ